jgi:formate dehydrogenase subunit gamma
MSRLLATARHVLATLVLLAAITMAIPVSAQGTSSEPSPGVSQQQNAVVDPDALAVPEQKLLRESPRIQGSILIPDNRESMLIQPAGRTWDYFHEILLRWIGVGAIFGMLAILAVGYFVLGRLRIRAGRSGTRVQRFTAFERFSHWLTATSFVVLALTGLNITFGKIVLRPLIGPDAFSTIAQYAKYAHNYLSFAFVMGLVLVVTMWIKDNIPRRSDITWLREGGGFIASKHPTAGRFNAGEKLVFWFALGGGAAVAISGYLLIFPFYVANIAGMQVAQAVHSLIAVLFIAVILAHIYIGTLGMEGAFEAMWTGAVDLNWAKEHHDLWLKEQLAKARPGKQPTRPSPTAAE